VTGMTRRVFKIVLLCTAFSQVTFATPTISSVSPTSGTIGTKVIITGSNFGVSTGTVTFNGVTAVSYYQ
jgi:hypothetical protein